MNLQTLTLAGLLLSMSATAAAGEPAATPPAAAPEAKPEPAADAAPRKWNDIARYLAGLPVEDGALAEIAKRPEAVSHRKWFDKSWKAEEERFLTKVAPWAKAEFEAVQKLDRVVFYPFSGPDLVTVHTLFPNARRYVLFGLEPEGALPDVTAIKPARLRDNLAILETSLKTILTLSFFKTIDMRKDFKAAELDGTAPILLAFLARTGNEVLGIEPVKVNDEGAPETYSGKIKKQAKGPVVTTGVRIRFRAGPDAPAQEIEYYSVDISDDALAKNVPFQKLLAGLAPSTSYLKSASYLMHKEYFTKIRTTLLDVSDFLLQDDSGIPVKFFPAPGWKLQLYGTYDKPIALFALRGQADLKELFKDKAQVKELPFGIGYNYKPGRSNLMSATKVRE